MLLSSKEFPTRSLCRNIHMLRFRTAIRLLICRHSTKPESSLFKTTLRFSLKDAIFSTIGFLDSGIDYTNPVFQNLDNTTRIRAIWDKTVQTGTMPEHFSYGSEFTEEQINEALRSDSPFHLFHPLMKQGTELTPLPLHAEAPFLKKNFSAPHLKPLSPL